MTQGSVATDGALGAHQQVIPVFYCPDEHVAGGGSDIRAEELTSAIDEVFHVVRHRLSDPRRAGSLRNLLRVFAAMFCGVPPRLAQAWSLRNALAVRRTIPKTGLFVVSTTFTAALVPRRARPRMVFDVHNIESRVMIAAMQRSGLLRQVGYRLTVKWTARYERRLAADALRVWPVSSGEAHWFAVGGASTLVVPNGCRVPPEAANVVDSSPCLLFVGSLASGFNRDGVQWFLDDVWPGIRRELPEATLCIVGKGGERFHGPGVQSVGFVSDLEPHYSVSRAAIVPLLSGAGTRLKIVEAAAWGLPVVSTIIGAEGIAPEVLRHIDLADDSESFGTACMRLLRDPRRAAERGMDARSAVLDFDWRVIGNLVNADLEAHRVRVSSV